MSWRTKGHYPFSLKFNRRESFHNPPLTYNPQSRSVQFFFRSRQEFLCPVWKKTVLYHLDCLLNSISGWENCWREVYYKIHKTSQITHKGDLWAPWTMAATILMLLTCFHHHRVAKASLSSKTKLNLWLLLLNLWFFSCALSRARGR